MDTNEVDWNVIDADQGTEAAIVGYYDVDEGESVTVIATLHPANGGVSWSLEDEHVGYIDGGWCHSKQEAKAACIKNADEWCADDPQAWIDSHGSD